VVLLGGRGKAFCGGADLKELSALDASSVPLFEGTRFSMPEVRLGIPSVVEAALLPRLMGAGRAAWLVLLQLWEEAPLATSIEKSIALFAQAKR
jgi:enoyl-CoA hydratase